MSVCSLRAILFPKNLSPLAKWQPRTGNPLALVHGCRGSPVSWGVSVLLGRCTVDECSVWNWGAKGLREGRDPKPHRDYYELLNSGDFQLLGVHGKWTPGLSAVLIRCFFDCTGSFRWRQPLHRALAYRETQRLAPPTRQIKGLFSFPFLKKSVQRDPCKNCQFLHPSM